MASWRFAGPERAPASSSLRESRCAQERRSGGHRVLMGEPEVVLMGEARGCEPILHAELAVQVAEVELHGLLGHPQLLADGFVREPAGQRLEHCDLALREPG